MPNYDPQGNLILSSGQKISKLDPNFNTFLQQEGGVAAPVTPVPATQTKTPPMPPSLTTVPSSPTLEAPNTQPRKLGPTEYEKLRTQYKVNPTNFDQYFERRGSDIYLKSQAPLNLQNEQKIQAQIAANQADQVDSTVPFVSGLDVTIKNIQDAIGQSFAGSDKIAAEGSSLSQKIVDQLSKLTNRGNDELALREQYGYSTNVKQLQEINTQMATLSAKFNKSIEDLSAGTGLTTTIGGKQGQLRRQMAVELGGLAAVAQALQGNITLAKETAKETVDLQYEPVLQEIDNLKFQLEVNMDSYDKQQKKDALAYQELLNERTRAIEEQKTERNNILNLAVTAGGNTAPNDVINSILKATTLEGAIKAAGQYLRKPTDPKDNAPVKIGVDANGNDLFYNPATGSVVTAGQISGSSANLGNQVGTISGLPAYDTRAANPGVARSNRNNNPGNIKVSDYTKAFDGVIGVESSPAGDGGNFLIFDSPEAGIAAIGRLLLEGKSYKGVTAEQAIKKYNGGGAYGAASVGLNPNQDFQAQIKDPVKLQAVATAIAMAEGYKPAAPQTNGDTDAVQGYVSQIQSGSLKIDNVPEKLRNQVVIALSKIPSKTDTAVESKAKDKITLIDSLLNSNGLDSSVGPNKLTRKSIFDVDGLTGARQSFIAGVQQLISQDTLDTLLQLKQAGGTLGALSDGERKTLENAASKISTWAIKDPKTQEVTGYNVSEKAFRDELNRIKALTEKAVQISVTPKLMLSPEELQQLGQMTTNPANYY